MTNHDKRIADNVFYVAEDGKKFAIVVNGIDLYEFMGYSIWLGTKALSKITNQKDAQDLADFLNKLFQFSQAQKQKEIQKALGIFSEENIKKLVDEKIDSGYTLWLSNKKES